MVAIVWSSDDIVRPVSHFFSFILLRSICHSRGNFLLVYLLSHSICATFCVCLVLVELAKVHIVVLRLLKLRILLLFFFLSSNYPGRSHLDVEFVRVQFEFFVFFLGMVDWVSVCHQNWRHQQIAFGFAIQLIAVALHGRVGLLGLTLHLSAPFH